MMYIRGRNFFRSKILFNSYISILWCLGLFFGSIWGLHSSTGFLSVMHGFDVQSASIVGRYALLFLPFILSAFAIYYGFRLLILPIVFCKAFTFSYACCCVISMFGSAGWMLRLLLVFFDSCTIPFLILLWLGNMADKHSAIRYDLVYCSIYMLIIACVDRYVILPFTAELLNNL